MLFAAKDFEAQFYDRLRVYMWTVIALAAIGLLIWLVLRIRTWFFESDDSDVPVEEMITQFRQLKRDGELSDEEFRLISQRLAKTSNPPVVPAATSPQLPKPNPTEVNDSTDVE